MKNTFFFLLFLLIFEIPQPQGQANRYIGDIYHLYDHDWSTAEEGQEKAIT